MKAKDYLKLNTLNSMFYYFKIFLTLYTWVIHCSYNSFKNEISNHLEVLSEFLDFYSSSYSSIIILGDFNVCVEEARMATFCKSYDLKSLIKQPTCYKNPARPTYVSTQL